MTPLPTGDHLEDEALLLLAAGELPQVEEYRAEAHLVRCEQCRTRLHLLGVAADEAGELGKLDRLPSATLARHRLDVALTRAQQERAAPRLKSFASDWAARLCQPALILRAGALVVLLVVAVTYRQVSRPLQDLMAAYEDTGPEPDHALTPGSATPLSLAEVCRLSDDDLDPPVSKDVQRAVFHAYRMDDRTAKAYQVDYLINPQLGGDSTLQNLWPEPYHATVWNATAKDALETRLHGMVCSGELDLQTAQADLASDWIAAYKKYFRTARPVRTMAVLHAPQDR